MVAVIRGWYAEIAQAIGEDGKCGGGGGGGRNPANGFTESNRSGRRLTGQTDRKWSATAYKESMITKWYMATARALARSLIRSVVRANVYTGRREMSQTRHCLALPALRLGGPFASASRYTLYVMQLPSPWLAVWLIGVEIPDDIHRRIKWMRGHLIILILYIPLFWAE